MVGQEMVGVVFVNVFLWKHAWLIPFLFCCICKCEHRSWHSRWCCCVSREHQEEVSCLLLLKWCTIWKCEDVITGLMKILFWFFTFSFLVRILVITKININFKSHVSDAVSDNKFGCSVCQTDWLGGYLSILCLYRGSDCNLLYHDTVWLFLW